MDASSNADAFCANGVLFADHTPSAKAVQMRYDHQQVNFYLENEDAESNRWNDQSKSRK